MKLHGLPPVIDDDISVIILGSFPSEESLRQKQYYANPRNHFWKVLGAVLDIDLESLPYEERMKKLLAHHIGIWDAYAQCERTGSLDNNIRDPVANDFFCIRTPHLKRIFCNGRKASQVASMLPFEPDILPSTSPAHTMTLPEKIAAWNIIKEFL